MGQQQQVIAVQMEHAHLKLVAELYDKAEQTLLQVINQSDCTRLCKSQYRHLRFC